MSKKFQYAADQIIPDSFVFCIILTIIVFLTSMIFTKTNPVTMFKYWYDGFWSQCTFAFQMSFMVVTCAACAKAPQVRKLLRTIANIPKNAVSAMILLMVFGYVSSFINWAFCTILTPILAMQLSKQVKGLHFPIMIAAGYSCMCLGQCLGPSASVYALLASEGHFMQDVLGVLTQDQTVYNSVNVIVWLILAIATMIIAVMTRPPIDETVEYETALDVVEVESNNNENEAKTPADKMNGSKILMYFLGIGGLIVIIESFITKGIMASLGINFVIFVFITINCFLYDTPRKFVEAFKDSIQLATEVMMQFPFYGGIAGMMSSSGFGGIIADSMLRIANANTLPIWSYISASVVNLFIPSQGGQWIVQGPILIDAATKLGADYRYVINAFVFGDEATNLLQPLYLIPALSVVGMKLKDAWGFCAFIWLFWLILTCLGLYFVPLLV